MNQLILDINNLNDNLNSSGWTTLLNNLRGNTRTPLLTDRNTAYVDSGASVSVLKAQAEAVVAKVQDVARELGVPNGDQLTTTETLDLLLDKLPPEARKAFRVPGLRHNLLAVATFCNAGCTVTFTKHGVYVKYNGEIVLCG